MNPSVDVAALAALARLEVPQAELETLEKELPDILSFVETMQAVSGSTDGMIDPVHNVMRDDTEAHESGAHTESLLAAAPKTKKGYIVVKQVVSRKNA